MYYFNVTVISLCFMIVVQFLVPLAELKEVDKVFTSLAEASDLSEPGPNIKFAWSRIAGREDAVFLNLPSNQLADRIMLPHEPSPAVIAKFDPYTNTGEIAIMRMRQVGPTIQAQLLKISPSVFQNIRGLSFYNFAWLQWNGKEGCVYGEKSLSVSDPPNVNNAALVKATIAYDHGLSTSEPKLDADSTNQEKVNRSSYYYHQRMNTDACWDKVAFRQFDKGNGLWNNISQLAFFRLVAMAQHIHKAPVAFTAIASIDTSASTQTYKSFFRKKVVTTTSFYLKPQWWISTKKLTAGQYSDYVESATGDANHVYSFVQAKGEHTFPTEQTLIHQVSQTQSGWTGIFIVLAMIVMALVTAIAVVFTLGAALPGVLAGWTSITAILGAGAVGALAGLIATGFSPTVNTTAKFTPYSYSAYELDPSVSMEGEMKTAATRGRDLWVSPEMAKTPGGVQTFITNIDYRKALACGGASKATDACTTPAIEQIDMNDSRFNEVFGEMFYNATKRLQEYTQPY